MSCEDLLEVQDTARDGVESIREIVRGLRPPALEEFGLRAALGALATRFRDRTGIAVQGSIAPHLPRLAPEVELAIYRVAQESLTNVVRHASADSVELSVAAVDGVVRLRVRDDGCGLPAGAVVASGGGVAGMRERALLLHGRLLIGAAPDGGTEVVLEVPG
jgi:two-component system, NarL family, sensor histidine kinase UhpB